MVIPLLAEHSTRIDAQTIDAHLMTPQPAAPYTYPVDPTDGWEPGPPTMRGMAPSMLGGAVIPLALHYLVRPHLHSDATALMIAGVPASGWVAIGWARHRALDPIGTITLFGFVAGVMVSTRRKLYDGLWDLPPSRFVFTVITVFWSVLLLGESALRVLLAIMLPTGPFLAVSPVLAATMFGGGGALTIWFSNTAIEREKLIVEAGLSDAGTSWRSWSRQYLRPVRIPTESGR